MKKWVPISKTKTIIQKKVIEKTLTSILESVDTVVFIASTTTFVTLSVTVIGLIVVPISAGSACSLLLANKNIHKKNLKN